MLFETAVYGLFGSLVCGSASLLILHSENQEEKEREKRKAKKKYIDATSTEYYERQPIGKMYNIVIEDDKDLRKGVA